MKNFLTHIKGVPLQFGEITVIQADDCTRMLEHCAMMADTFQEREQAVLVINCGVSSMRFNEFIQPVYEKCCTRLDPKKYRPMYFISSTRGELVDQSEYVEEILQSIKPRFVILVGWEWASNTYRRKEKLMYFLRNICEDFNLSVLVYSQKPSNAVAGRFDRGGLGKLAIAAASVMKLKTVERSDVQKFHREAIIPDETDMQEAAECVQLSINKINNLEGENRDLPRIADIIPASVPDYEEVLQG
jgi:hypothetical protein